MEAVATPAPDTVPGAQLLLGKRPSNESMNAGIYRNELSHSTSRNTHASFLTDPKAEFVLSLLLFAPPNPGLCEVFNDECGRPLVPRHVLGASRNNEV